MPFSRRLPPTMPRWLLCCALLSTGCASRPAPLADPAPLRLPPAAFACPAAPDIPGAAATQRDTALFVTELWQAHDACRSRLDALARIYGNTPEAQN